MSCCGLMEIVQQTSNLSGGNNTIAACPSSSRLLHTFRARQRTGFGSGEWDSSQSHKLAHGGSTPPSAPNFGHSSGWSRSTAGFESRHPEHGRNQFVMMVGLQRLGPRTFSPLTSDHRVRVKTARKWGSVPITPNTTLWNFNHTPKAHYNKPNESAPTYPEPVGC